MTDTKLTKRWMRIFNIFSVITTFAAVWNAKHGYFYWAAGFALFAIDALLTKYHDEKYSD